MNYTDAQLEENYEKFMKMIRDRFTGERLEKLEHMYSEDELGIRLMISPASGKVFYHNAYVGGYMDHIFNIVRVSTAMNKLFQSGGGVPTYTDEELMFAVIHHDLGKLGDAEGHEGFLPETSKWHRDNQGIRFKNNPDLQFMKVPDRSQFMLTHYGIKMTEQEWLGIRLSDGAYDKTNHSYLISYSKDYAMKYNLPYIVHWSDHMASVIEGGYNEDD